MCFCNRIWWSPLFTACFFVDAEVTVPVSMKEVGGYIEKQVAYLSGETAVIIFGHTLSVHVSMSGVSCTCKRLVLFIVSRGSWGRLQRHSHTPRMLSFQWHTWGSFSQSLYIPHSHSSVCFLHSTGVSLFCSAPNSRRAGLHSAQCDQCPTHVLRPTPHIRYFHLDRSGLTHLYCS